jgi:hypothetical protein
MVSREQLGEQAEAIPMLGLRPLGINDKTVRTLRKALHTDPKVLSRIASRGVRPTGISWTTSWFTELLSPSSGSSFAR